MKNGKMKILVVAHNDVHGTGERTRNLLKNLDQKFKILYVTPPHPQNKELKKRKNIEVEVISDNRILGFLQRNTKILRSYDLIHSFKPLLTSSLPGVITKILKNKPFVLDWDDLEGVRGYAGSDNPFRREMINFSTSFIPHFADAITTVSPFLQRMTSDFADSYLIPNCVDLEEFSPGIEPEYNFPEPTAVFIGIFGKSSDADLAIKAMKYVKSGKLVMVGDGPRKNEFKEIAKRNGVQEKIIWLGYQDREKIPGILTSCDVALLPLKNNLQNKARSPVKLGQYLASGLPVITNPVGIITNLIENRKNGFLIEENPPKMGETLNEILENKHLRSNLSKNARKIAEKELDWEESSRRLSRIYKNLKD